MWDHRYQIVFFKRIAELAKTFNFISLVSFPIISQTLVTGCALFFLSGYLVFWVEYMAFLSAAYVFGLQLPPPQLAPLSSLFPSFGDGVSVMWKWIWRKGCVHLMFLGGYMVLWGIFGTQLAPHQLSRLSLLSPAAAQCHRLPAADGLFFDQNTICTYFIEYRKHTEYRINGNPNINRKAEKRSTDTQTSCSIVPLKVFAENINKQCLI